MVLWWDKYSAQGGLNEQFVYILGNNLPNSLENISTNKQKTLQERMELVKLSADAGWNGIFFFLKQSHAHLYTKLSVCDM